MINFLMDKLYNILKMYRSANKNSIFNRIMKKSYNFFAEQKVYGTQKPTYAYRLPQNNFSNSGNETFHGVVFTAV